MASKLKITTKWPSLLIGLFFLLVLAQFIQTTAVRLTTLGPAQDFEVFYLAGKQVLQNQNPYLKIATDVIRNPPPALLFFAPLARLPINTSEVWYFLLSSSAFLAGLIIILKTIARFGKWTLIKTWQFQALALALCLLFFPLRHNLASGQVNSFLFLALSLSLWLYLDKKIKLSGLVLAIGLWLKITPVIFLPYLLLLREYRLVKFTVAWLLAWGLTANLILGPTVWMQYQHVSASFLNFDIPAYYNQALSGFFSRLGLAETGFLLGLVFWLGSFFWISKKLGKITLEKRIIIWNLSILTMTIFVPFAWQYHLTIGLIPIITSVWLGWKNKAGLPIWSLIAAAYLLTGANIKNPSHFTDRGIIATIALSHATLGTLILYALNISWLKRN